MSTVLRPNDLSTPGIHPNNTPEQPLTSDEIAALTEVEQRHVDYDRHPLRVRGLDHYVDGPVSSERFHVW
jgi:hypothetical protein